MWLWTLPIFSAVFGIAGFWTVLGISVANGSTDLTKEFPLISICSNANPQSSVFAQTCNICCGLALWIQMIRFQQVRDYGHHGQENTVAAVCGAIFAFGLSMTGNFQRKPFERIHLLAACTTFIFCLIYFWIQLYLTYRAQPSQDRYWVGPVRAILCTLSTLLFIGCILFNLYALSRKLQHGVFAK